MPPLRVKRPNMTKATVSVIPTSRSVPGSDSGPLCYRACHLRSPKQQYSVQVTQVTRSSSRFRVGQIRNPTYLNNFSSVEDPFDGKPNVQLRERDPLELAGTH